MKQNTNIVNEGDAVLWFNMIFLVMILTLLFYYVVTANSIASKNYRTQILADKIELLSETNNLLMSQKLALDTPVKISEFARSQQLIEAKNISYIFEKKNVALQR